MICTPNTTALLRCALAGTPSNSTIRFVSLPPRRQLNRMGVLAAAGFVFVTFLFLPFLVLSILALGFTLTLVAFAVLGSDVAVFGGSPLGLE